MKGIRYGILILAGFCMGWLAQSLMGISMRKFANRRFLDESEVSLVNLRAEIAHFKLREKHFPSGVGELVAKGDLNPADPPYESMTHSARWVSVWDGDGGFIYISGTGEVYINADVSREKFFSSDWKRVENGTLFPKGVMF